MWRLGAERGCGAGWFCLVLVYFVVLTSLHAPASSCAILLTLSFIWKDLGIDFLGSVFDSVPCMLVPRLACFYRQRAQEITCTGMPWAPRSFYAIRHLRPTSQLIASASDLWVGSPAKASQQHT